jgi:hypothetical protein
MWLLFSYAAYPVGFPNRLLPTLTTQSAVRGSGSIVRFAFLRRIDLYVNDFPRNRFVDKALV